METKKFNETEKIAWRQQQRRFHVSITRDKKGKIAGVHRWKLPRSGERLPSNAMFVLSNARSSTVNLNDVRNLLNSIQL